MDNSISPSPTGKRGRNSSVILTDRLCEKRVTKRTKLYDRKCPGLYISITTTGVATFLFKFTDRQTGKQRTGWLGVYNPETFTVEDARSKVYGLKAMGGEALAEVLIPSSMAVVANRNTAWTSTESGVGAQATMSVCNAKVRTATMGRASQSES
ncbi:Arm DNA-binding domain-containing protein [Bradyrhizobium japonicum]|uniref:Arm DNA-binding domain-containing protein n=1 Tax=Bradyrhizobium japonicum TaxID=375 RepID=UPI00339A953F